MDSPTVEKTEQELIIIGDVRLLCVFHGSGPGIAALYKDFIKDAPLWSQLHGTRSPSKKRKAKFGFQQVGIRKGFYSHPREDAVIMTREFPQNAE